MVQETADISVGLTAFCGRTTTEDKGIGILRNLGAQTSNRWIRTSVALFLLALLVVPYSNCSSSHDSGSASGPSINYSGILASLRAQKTSLFNAKCVSCHNATTTDNDLRDLTSIDYLVDNNFIDIGQPQTSVLYLRVVDGTMPPATSGIPAVTEDELNVLRDWIAAEGDNWNTIIGGGGGGGGGGTGAPTFADVQRVLRNRCTNCHRAGGSAPPNLDVARNVLVTTSSSRGPLVVPGNASQSRLYLSYSSMPQGAVLGIGSADAVVIRDWINNGAL